MAHAITFARQHAVDAAPLLRSIIVSGCALALTLAGQVLPF